MSARSHSELSRRISKLASCSALTHVGVPACSSCSGVSAHDGNEESNRCVAILPVPTFSGRWKYRSMLAPELKAPHLGYLSPETFFPVTSDHPELQRIWLNQLHSSADRKRTSQSTPGGNFGIWQGRRLRTALHRV